MQRKEIEVGGDYAVYIERLGDKGDNVGYHHSPKLLP